MKLAVFGDPISHSRSPAIHNAALVATGRSGTYEARRVDDRGLRTAFEDVRAGRLSGFNVTMPHKSLAAELCDRLDPDAARARSVNTVALIDDAIWGFSTDIGGIADAWNGLPMVGPVLILGAGGAAAAAMTALADRPIYVAARRFGAGSELGIRLGRAVAEVRWGVPVVDSVVVNCTPIGMQGDALPGDVLATCGGLFDMAYGSATTPAVLAARTEGLSVVEGLDFLVAQAGRSFRIWTGENPPIEVMRKSAKNP